MSKALGILNVALGGVTLGIYATTLKPMGLVIGLVALIAGVRRLLTPHP